MRQLIVILLFCIGWPALAISQDIVINEVLAVNNSVIADENGQYSDYIEITNKGIKVIDLTGYHLSDDKDELGVYTFPNTLLKPGEFLLLWADGKPETGSYHLPFKLTSKGETVYLTYPNLLIADRLKFKRQYDDVAFGRIPNSVKPSYQRPSPNAKYAPGDVIGLDRKRNKVKATVTTHNDSLLLRWSVPDARRVRVIVADKNDKPVIKEKIKSAEGQTDVSGLPSGKYTLLLSKNRYRMRIKKSTP